MYTYGRWSLDVVGKAAIGVQQPVRQAVQPGDHRREQRHGGRAASSAAIRRPLQEFSRNRFSAIPELR